MSFASDQLYNGYLRRNMPTIVSKVKVKEIIVHLPCLTAHDRENIEAKRETYGNYDGMVLLLDCLKRRENWPEQFIEALEACEHSTIAADIRAEYDALRGVNNSNPGSPSTTVIRAHVHPAPSDSRVSVPESGGNSQPAAQASPPPVHPQAPSPPAHIPQAVSPPEPVPEPPRATQVELAPTPSTPPPSPETQHPPATTPPPQREANDHQEPEENSESDIQDMSAENGVIPDQVNAGKIEASVNSVATPSPSRPVEQCETDTLSHPDPLQTTAAVEVSPPRSPSPPQADSDVIDGSSSPTLTPGRPPVQETGPPVDRTTAAPVVLEPEETSDPAVTQIVESSPQIETAATTPPPPGSAGVDDSVYDDDDTLCVSKPGQLISIQQQNHDGPAVPSHDASAEPYSGNSQRLEISYAEPDADASAHVPACAAVNSATANAISGQPCRENGIALNHNGPEENHYESPCPSLDMQDVQVNVMQVSEEPSVLNLDGQTSAPQAQIINGEAAKEIGPSPPCDTITADTALSSDTPSSESYQPFEPAAADIATALTTLPDSGGEGGKAPSKRQANTKYILTAAGVGAIALLMAWKFKN